MIVYRTRSFFQIILYFILKVGYLVIAGIVLFHFKENPPVVVFIALLCFLFFLVTGSDEIIVYKDRVKFKSGSIIKLFRREVVFRMSDIISINIEGNYDTGDEMYNPQLTSDRKLNKLKIQVKSDQVHILNTSIYIKKLKQAVLEIQTLRGVSE